MSKQINTLEQDLPTGLGHLLADSYALLLKTHNFHWNVTGPQFQSLHLLFEAQYNDLFKAVDEIAERIRVLGHRAPGSFSEFSQLLSIEEGGEEKRASQMLHSLVESHLQVIGLVQTLLKKSEEANDEGTQNLLSAQLEWHEKTLWMLRSSQGE